jgi:hypothetical protein
MWKIQKATGICIARNKESIWPFKIEYKRLTPQSNKKDDDPIKDNDDDKDNKGGNNSVSTDIKDSTKRVPLSPEMLTQVTIEADRVATYHLGSVFIFNCFLSASLSFMDPLFLIFSNIFLYLYLFGWSVWKRIEYRFCETLSMLFLYKLTSSSLSFRYPVISDSGGLCFKILDYGKALYMVPYICIYTYMFIYMYVYICIYIYIYKYMYLYMDIYIYTYLCWSLTLTHIHI